MYAELLALIATFGLPALFGILAVTSFGVPFPDSLLLIVVGSLVAQGDLSFWPVIAVGTAGAVTGDQVGYALGYWGGRPMLNKVTGWIGGADKVVRAEEFSRKWAGPGIFFSRWLVGPLGPWVNLTSGLAAYSWRRFFALDLAGELLWLLLYVGLGRIFSDKVMTISNLLGNLNWFVLGAVATFFLGRKLLANWRDKPPD